MAGLLVAAAAISPAAASSQTSASGVGSGDWQFTAAIYGYLPDLTGKVVFPGDLGSSDIDVPIGDILDHLKMAFMGAFGAHNGQWGMSADALYMDLGGSKKRTHDFPLPGRSVPVSADVSVDVKAWVWTLAGEYRVVSNQAWTLDVLAGARSLYFNPSLDYRVAGPAGSIEGHKDSSGTAWDGIVGTRGRYTFGDHDRWFIPFYPSGLPQGSAVAVAVALEDVPAIGRTEKVRDTVTLDAATCAQGADRHAANWIDVQGNLRLGSILRQRGFRERRFHEG
jgi:hypothetical protein